MDTQSAPAVAARLGVSLPRLHRFVEGRPGVARKGKRILVSEELAGAAEERFGRIPRVAGLSRVAVHVLVALSRRPRGLVSVRQVAAAARVSPTAASRALATLERAGYVSRVVATLFDGEVVERPVYQVRWDTPEWRTVAPLLADAVLPAPPDRAVPSRVPPRLANVFWTGDAAALDVNLHPTYTARRILNEGRHRPEALAFLGSLPPDDLRRALAETDSPARSHG